MRYALASAYRAGRREAVLREFPPNVPWIKQKALVDRSRN
jgi:hypothetical protein